MKNKINASSMQLVARGSTVPYNSAPANLSHWFRIIGEIGDVEDYSDLLDVMDSANDGDVIHLYINSIGGSLTTSISIIHAMQRTRAAVVCHGDGEVTSAASLLFFSGDQLVIYPYTFGLLHDGSYATDHQQTHKHLEFAQAMNTLIKRMCHDVYQPYFSHEEVDHIMNGQDCHFFRDDLIERFKKVNPEAVTDCGGGVVSFVNNKNLEDSEEGNTQLVLG